MTSFDPVIIVRADEVKKDDWLLGMSIWNRGEATPTLVLRSTRNGNDRQTRKITFFQSLDPIVLANDTLVAIVRKT